MGQLSSLMANNEHSPSSSSMTSQRRLARKSRGNLLKVVKAEDVPAYKGSWPVEQLIDYIDNGRIPATSNGCVQTAPSLQRILPVRDRLVSSPGQNSHVATVANGYVPACNGGRASASVTKTSLPETTPSSSRSGASTFGQISDSPDIPLYRYHTRGKNSITKKTIAMKKDPTESDSGCGDCITAEHQKDLLNSVEATVPTLGNAVTLEELSTITPAFLSLLDARDCDDIADYDIASYTYKELTNFKPSKEDEFVIVQRRRKTSRNVGNGSATVTHEPRSSVKHRLLHESQQRLGNKNPSSAANVSARHTLVSALSNRRDSLLTGPEEVQMPTTIASVSESPSSYASANSSVRSSSPVQSEAEHSGLDALNAETIATLVLPGSFQRHCLDLVDVNISVHCAESGETFQTICDTVANDRQCFQSESSTGFVAESTHDHLASNAMVSSRNLDRHQALSAYHAVPQISNSAPCSFPVSPTTLVTQHFSHPKSGHKQDIKCSRLKELSTPGKYRLPLSAPLQEITFGSIDFSIYKDLGNAILAVSSRNTIVSDPTVQPTDAVSQCGPSECCDIRTCLNPVTFTCLPKNTLRNNQSDVHIVQFGYNCNIAEYVANAEDIIKVEGSDIQRIQQNAEARPSVTCPILKPASSMFNVSTHNSGKVECDKECTGTSDHCCNPCSSLYTTTKSVCSPAQLVRNVTLPSESTAKVSDALMSSGHDGVERVNEVIKSVELAMLSLSSIEQKQIGCSLKNLVVKDCRSCFDLSAAQIYIYNAYENVVNDMKLGRNDVITICLDEVRENL